MRENKSQKTCMFYVSDYHFEMIGLSNMKKEIEKNKKVIILTQEDLTETLNTVLSKINLKEEEKLKIEGIDWKSKDVNKQKELQKIIKEIENLSIYVKGDENYIQSQNNKIKELIDENKDITITDCYNYFKVENKLNEITKNYEEKLMTDGKIAL